MNVFDITLEHQQLMQEIEESTGEITPEIAERLAINESNLNTKVRAYYHIIKTTESQIGLAKEEQERLSNVRKVKENLIKRLKTSVDIAVEEFGVIKKDAKAKSLDLGDLKVWQKKTEALNIDGDIDDERFCNKSINFELNYRDAEKLMMLLNMTIIFDENVKPIPSTSIIVIKDKLKEWLLDNEEEHKKLINEHNERLHTPNIEFEENKVKMTDLSPEKENDIKILLNTTINHNSTVVFK